LTFADRILLRNGSVSQYRGPERDSEATLINPVKSALRLESGEVRLQAARSLVAENGVFRY
jgi:hypothetical protein